MLTVTLAGLLLRFCDWLCDHAVQVAIAILLTFLLLCCAAELGSLGA